MSICIVGGSGFVGSRLISVLKNSKVYNLDKRKSDFHNNISSIVDIRVESDIKFSSDTNLVVLLAAEHRDDVSPSSLYYDVNVQGTKNVLNAMDKHGVKNIIFTSSVAVYGLDKINPDESHKHDPFNHYGKSKYEAELVINEWFNQNPKEKSVTIIRPTVIFGERNRGNVYNLLKQVCSEKFLMIGDGLNKKSMAYVGNVVAFIKFLIEEKESGYQVFNYADKPDFNMTELVTSIEHKMKTKIPKVSIPFWLGMACGYFFDTLSFLSKNKLFLSSVRVKKFCATTQFNSMKAHNLFEAPYTLREGLNKTLENEFINQKDDDVLFYSE
tara:strand:- start:1634 stop:2614 length:981 start_codon:yes stop_codon:yes gene_type:complete